MNILVVEASGARVALAAFEISGASDAVADLKVRAVWSSDDVRALSRELAWRLAQLLENAGWTMSDVAALAVGLGPGSWTSLRVVLATCKTLAQARDWKLIGMPSFDGIARAAWEQCQSEAAHALSSTRTEDALIAVVAPSRAGEIYSKTFRACAENWTVEQGERVGSSEALREEIDTEKLVVVTGEASRETVKSWGHSTSPQLLPIFVDVEDAALHIGLLAAQRLSRGDSDDPLTLQPLYVALSAAERNLAAKTR